MDGKADDPCSSGRAFIDYLRYRLRNYLVTEVAGSRCRVDYDCNFLFHIVLCSLVDQNATATRPVRCQTRATSIVFQMVTLAINASAAPLVPNFGVNTKASNALQTAPMVTASATSSSWRVI